MAKVVKIVDEYNKARRGDVSLTFLYAQCIKCGWLGIMALISDAKLEDQDCTRCGEKKLRKIKPN